MDIELRNQSSVKVIKLRGRLNLGDAVDSLRQNFDDLLANGDTRFVVDLGEVTMLDSSGIGLLGPLPHRRQTKRRVLKLLNPSKFAVQTLKMTGLLSLFEVFDNLDRAVASFG